LVVDRRGKFKPIAWNLMSWTANSVSIVFRPVEGRTDDEAGSPAITGGTAKPCSNFRAARENDPLLQEARMSRNNHVYDRHK